MRVIARGGWGKRSWLRGRQEGDLGLVRLDFGNARNQFKVGLQVHGGAAKILLSGLQIG